MNSLLKNFITPGIWFLLLMAVSGGLAAAAQSSGSQSNDKMKNQFIEPTIVEDSTLHPGVASAWVVGRHLLAAGDLERATQYLNYAYSVLPDVVFIALDYQEALAQAGFVQDAVKVMDQLIVSHPDSLQWRVKRSSLNLRLGKMDEALDDLEMLQEEDHSSAQLLETQALILASQGHEKKALSVYREGLKKYPDHTVAIYMGMIQIHQHKGNTVGIIDVCREAILALPLEPIFREIEVRSYVSLSQHKDALEAAQAADKVLLPAGLVEESMLLHLADIYVQDGEFTRAIVILSDEEAANGLGLHASLWLARLLLGSNQPGEMSGLIYSIEKKWPHSPRLWFLKGKLAEEEGQWDVAVQHYEHSVSLGTDDPEILLALIRALLVNNDDELALAGHGAKNSDLLNKLEQHTRRASAIAPEEDAEGQLVLGYAFRAILDYEQAIVHFKFAAMEPGFLKTAKTQASVCYDELGNIEKALDILQQLHSELPNDPEVANSLGYFLAEKNMDLKRAEKLVDSALGIEPGRGAFLDSKGWILYRNGHLDDAFDFLIRAVNVLPDDPIILEHLGIVLQEQKQYGQALDVLRRALRGGGDPKILGARIQELERLIPPKGK